LGRNLFFSSGSPSQSYSPAQITGLKHTTPKSFKSRQSSHCESLKKKKYIVKGYIRLQNLVYPFQLLIKVHIKRSNRSGKKIPVQWLIYNQIWLNVSWVHKKNVFSSGTTHV